MGAYLNTDIFLKKGKGFFSYLFDFIKEENLYVAIEETIVTFDGWPCINGNVVETASLDLPNSDIYLQKFLSIHFTMNNVLRCILITSPEDDNVINFSFGVDLDYIENERDYSEQFVVLNNAITGKIEKLMHDKLFQAHFLIASLSVESDPNYNSDIQSMFNEPYSNIHRWIIPKHRGDQITHAKFSKEEKENVIVFRYI